MSDNKQHARQQSDEITLYDLYRGLVERKFTLLSAVGVALLAATIYLFITPPVYEATARLTPPSSETIRLVTPDHPMAVLDHTAVFLEFQTYLESGETWRKFLHEHPDAIPGDVEGEPVDRSTWFPVSVATRKNRAAEYADVAFKHQNPVSASEYLGIYLKFTADLYAGEIVERLKTNLSRNRDNVAAEILVMRERARLLREDKIAQLQEDLDIARSLGITDSIFSGEHLTDNGNAIVVMQYSYPDYLRGTKALSTEIEALVKRKSDDPYIRDLREKQIELGVIDNLAFSINGFKPYSQSGSVVVPSRPVKPEKSKVLVMSVILGGVFGVLLIVTSRRKAVASDTGRSV